MPARRRAPTRSTRAAAIRTPTPAPELSDEEMHDASPGELTPVEAPDDDNDEDTELDEGEDDIPTSPVADSDGPTSRTRSSRSQAAAAAAAATVAAAAAPEPSPPPQPVKRRPGRPPKNRPIDWDTSDHAASDSTPKRRGGFRGRAFGGGRWKNRGGPSRVSQVPLDKEGNMATVRDDEVELPEDPEGETKVDKLGYLKGGREYRVRTFTIQDRGERLYMLSTEPARCIGFRDSYLFFQKHKQLFKIILSDEEKMDLIERDLMPHSYKGRAIGVVTARSVFREFGAQIIIGGKRIVDDYQVAAAREVGAMEGELAVPDDIMPGPGQEYDRNRYVAWHGASAVYHSGAPTVPLQNGKGEIKKRKVTVTGNNWQFEHAREASRFNSMLASVRRMNLNGVYDVHTNNMHYPQITQPTHAHWEQLTPGPSLSPASQPPVNGVTTTGTSNGTDHSIPTPKGPSIEATRIQEAALQPPSDFVYRNLLTVDALYRVPLATNLRVAGPDGIYPDVGPPGLLDVSEEVAAELPSECLVAFREAQYKEQEWRDRWTDEATQGHRGRAKIVMSGGVWGNDAT